MEEGSIAVLVDAKEEYTKQLISILKSYIYQGIKSIYQDAKDICHQDNTPDNVLMVFQDLLSRIPKWSQDIMNNFRSEVCKLGFNRNIEYVISDEKLIEISMKLKIL